MCELLDNEYGIKSNEKILYKIDDNYRVPNKNKTIVKDNQEWFATANEAQEWAKKNIGKSITRSPDGNGYIVKS